MKVVHSKLLYPLRYFDGILVGKKLKYDGVAGADRVVLYCFLFGVFSIDEL